MGRLERIATAIAAILAREGVDYLQSKAVFKVARQKLGLTAPPDRRGGVDRLILEEELGRWQGFDSRVHTGPAAALCRDGCSRGGSSKGSGGGGLLRSSS